MRPREVVAIVLAIVFAVCAGDRARAESTLLAQVRTTPGTVVPVPAPSVRSRCARRRADAVAQPTNPVWSSASTPSVSSGPNGSGLEIYNVYYNGHLCLQTRARADSERAVCAGRLVDASATGRIEVSFQADNVITGGLGGYAEPTSPPQTVCDTGGTHGDMGTFTGCRRREAERSVILTTQFLAGCAATR